MSPRISRICTYLFLAKIHGFLAKTQSSLKKLHESHVSTRIFLTRQRTTDNRQRIARARKEKIRVNSRDTWNLLCDFADFAREKILVIRVIRGKGKRKFCRYQKVFISLLPNLEINLKKEETAKRRFIITT